MSNYRYCSTQELEAKLFTLTFDDEISADIVQREKPKVEAELKRRRRREAGRAKRGRR